tara:strand:- start:1020 stop:1334 length:315 start_codon:yes stop_codon:yes gene_type:complete
MRKKGIMKNIIRKIKVSRLDFVNSSMLEVIKYNKVSKNLLVCFTGGAVYLYRDVPRNYGAVLFSAHDNGLSVGKVFNALIKDNPNIPFSKNGVAEMEYNIDKIN